MLGHGTGRHWCESKLSSHKGPFAEFYNTLSSSALAFIAIASLVLNWDYYIRIRPSAKYLHGLWILAAINTAYYHATLSLFGQILDELSLLWLLMYSAGIWAPGFPKDFKRKHKMKIQFGCFIATALCSLLAFVAPSANAYFLMALTAPTVAAVAVEFQEHKSRDTGVLATKATLIWFFGIFVWLLDRFACQQLLKFGFPYMHAIWHIAAALGGYMACVLFIYGDSCSRVKRSKPTMSYAFVLLPYVSFQSPFYEID